MASQESSSVGIGRIKVVIVGLLLAASLGLLIVMIARSLGGSALAEATRKRTLIDMETREVFRDMGIPEGETQPFKHPKTGERTLVSAERCYWTRDGQAKMEPTYVLLNSYLGDDSPTMCPDCGRRVVGHNPMPPDNLLLEAAARAQSGNGG